MTSLRRHKQRIGLFLAIFMGAAAAFPGLLAAAQGMQLQAPICSPGGTKHPVDTEPAYAPDDHCQICPAGSLENLASLRDGVLDDLKSPYLATVMVARSEQFSRTRAELFPVQGRSPPTQT